jgi:class 3 adenylate cyclase/Skp family chaperone for outer membrane proteins
MQDDSASTSGRKPSLERRLATILMADVVGYSKMMGEDEERTIEILRGHREIFDEMLKVHRGRIFNTAGDAILAEFPSAVDAVRCATEVQAALRTRNDHLPPEQRMWFRIGVNLGDVVVQHGDLLGDGVNVAARIQTVAEPGGICIAGSVYDQIQNKLSLHFRQLGEKTFKNIAQPIRTFSIEDTSPGAIPPLGRPAAPRGKRPIVAAAAIIALIALAAGGYWMFRGHEARIADEARIAAEGQRKTEQEKAEQERTAAETARQQLALQAELEAARSALQQADASKKRAEQDRAAAEAAQREAKLQSELQTAKEALQQADASVRRADQNRKSATTALQAAESAAQEPKATPRAGPFRSAVQAAIARRADSSDANSKSEPTPSGAVTRFNGTYPGRICSPREEQPGPTENCWKAVLTVQDGKAFATWKGRFAGEPSYARGTISTQGAVDIVVDGFSANGRPMVGTMSGTWNNDTIKVAGTWRNKHPINAAWKRVP